jgi:acyl carrier protein
MDINQFIEKFSDQLIDESQPITYETEFRKLSSWDSLTGMAVIMMIEDEYKVKVENDTFRKFNTIGNIFDYVIESQKSV